MNKLDEEAVKQEQVDPKESPFKYFQEHPDRYLWALCVVPIFCAIIELLAGVPPTYSFILYIIPNIVLSVLDEKELKKTDRVAPAHWMVLIVPIYIWQRLKLNKQDKKIVIGWVMAFIFSIFISNMINDGIIEDEACNLVTDIIHNQFYNKSVDCVAVTLDKEVKDGFYKATATLTNGNDIDITVDLRKDGQIYVQIPNQ
ncbi:hypothetical protein [Vibrio metschnikovii]|uniref:hypothetical protein n=1 Tax=Vibrio metschnikovii TaxID=28172 RepID=UPI001C2FC99E|nr:hypothetical protein [Vibrio metschnikovii]